MPKMQVAVQRIFLHDWHRAATTCVGALGTIANPGGLAMSRILAAAWCFLLLVTPVLGQTAEEKQATIEYLRNLQTASGGFMPAKAPEKKLPPSLRATSAAIRALKYFGGTPADAKSAAEFVARCFDKEAGGFRDHPDVADLNVGLTAVGIMAVIELKMPMSDYREKVEEFLNDRPKDFEEIRIAVAGFEALKRRSSRRDEWYALIIKMEGEKGWGEGDGKARDTGSAVAALLRLGVKLQDRDVVQYVKTIKNGQRTDGGFGKAGAKSSDLESCYRVTRALFMLKEKPNVDELRKFISRCRNSDGGYGLSPGQPSAVGNTYFAGIILHWLDELR